MSRREETIKELNKAIFALTNAVVQLSLEGEKSPPPPKKRVRIEDFKYSTISREDENALLSLTGMPSDSMGTKQIKTSEAKQMEKYADGCFRTRPNGLLEYRFYDENKALRSVYGRSKEECFAKRTQIIKGKYVTKKTPKRDDSFGGWLKEWFNTYKAGKIGDAYKVNTLYYINDRIAPAIGSIPLKKLNGHDLQEFFNKFSDTPNTQKKMKALIFPCLEKAVRLGKIKLNPCEDVELQEHDAEHYRALEFDEQNAVLEGVNDNHRFAVKFLLCTGIRKTKAFELTVDAIDWDNHRITVVKKQKKGKNQTYSVPFLDELFEGVSIPKEGKLFKESENAFTCHIKRLYSALGIKGATIHSLRHSFVSSLYNIGAKLKKIQEWAGHNDFSMTSETYCHLMKNGNSYVKGYLDRLNKEFPL